MGNKKYISNQIQYKKMPGAQIVYWASNTIISAFSNNQSIDEYVLFRQGMATSDNNRFLRLWFEVEENKSNYTATDIDDAKKSQKKWFAYNKGGEYRKWYGNNNYVVNWENDGEEMKAFTATLPQGMNVRLKSREYYFKECYSWSKIASSNISFRYYPRGFAFDVAGCCVFNTGDNLYYYLGLSNSVVTKSLVSYISPTINYELDHLRRIPIIINDDKKTTIDFLVEECITISKDEWDSYETSWNFQKHELCGGNTMGYLIADKFKEWEKKSEERFQKLKENEEKINKAFIEIYGLQNELTSEVEDSEVSLRLANEEEDIKSLLSYLVGLVMGRYSLDINGIANAGGKLNKEKYITYLPDEDGIVPIYSFHGISDSLTGEILNLVKIIYGEDTYQKNIDYIAGVLNKKSDESSEETINRYLNEKFYNEHLKTYQKRPIYWMLSSGKQGAFKCLIYLHRYNKNTLALVNSKYFLPRTAMYKAERERLETRFASGQLDAREKKNVEAELKTIEKCEEELLEYGQVLDYLANQYIELDLDDGVKENYLKFQRIPLEVNGARVKKDLLVPFGLEKDKK